MSHTSAFASAFAAVAACVLALAVYFLWTPALDRAEQVTATTSPQQATSTRPQNPFPGVETGKSVAIGGRVVEVDIADTPAKRQQGLSGREGLAEDEGMLFIFPEDGLHSFWMKDMHFSIDILWLNSEGAIVHVVENASPSSYPASFLPETPARFVLELSAGSVARLDVKVGDTVALPR